MGVADCYVGASQGSRPGSSASPGGDAATCCSSEPDNASVYSELPPSDSFSCGTGERRSRCSDGGGGESRSRCSGDGSRYSGSVIDGVSRLNFGSSSDVASSQHQKQNLESENQREHRAAHYQSNEKTFAFRKEISTIFIQRKNVRKI